jgi:ribosomal RNA-processing protein 8
MFEEYHQGFRRQVEIWPENPVDTYIRLVHARAKTTSNHRAHKSKADRPHGSSPAVTSSPSAEPLPRTGNTCTIADLGCGDARLAQALAPSKKKLKLEILSYDLQSKPPHVIAADIAALPLADGAVNVAIFCLALMGTNWLDFVDEAYRILHWRGELWVAEIKSRFGRGAAVVSTTPGRVAHSVGNRQNKSTSSKAAKKASAEAADVENEAALAVEVDGQQQQQQLSGAQQTDVSAFVAVLRRRGFVLAGDAQGGEEAAAAAVDMHNKMFVTMRFVKAVAPTRGRHVPKAGEMGYDAGSAKPARKAKFLDVGASRSGEEELTDEVEAKVLKPCVYKLR